MAIEIERKFLVRDTSFLENSQGTYYKQGYIKTASLTAVRVRVIGEVGYLTIKGKNTGASRLEFEYPIPAEDANTMLSELCDSPLVEKTRYVIPHANFQWEVDVFDGDNKGLIVAEIELPEANTSFEKPDWAGEEVTDDSRYYNSNLAENPYKNWQKELREESND